MICLVLRICRYVMYAKKQRYIAYKYRSHRIDHIVSQGLNINSNSNLRRFGVSRSHDDAKKKQRSLFRVDYV